MAVRIVFFASLREQLACSSLDWEGRSPQETVASLREKLAREQFPESGAVLLADTVLAAVNQVMAQPEQAVADGDEVAFFPPVTGG